MSPIFIDLNFWANKTHCACKFFAFYAKHKNNLTWPNLSNKPLYAKYILVINSRKTMNFIITCVVHMMHWWFLHTKNIEDYNYCKRKFGPNEKKIDCLLNCALTYHSLINFSSTLNKYLGTSWLYLSL